jgi:hypothetical protein
MEASLIQEQRFQVFSVGDVGGVVTGGIAGVDEMAADIFFLRVPNPGP